MRKLRAAIDVGPLTSGDSVRGIGVYTRELLSALESLQKEKKGDFEVYPVDYFNHHPPSTNHHSPFTIHPDVIHFTRFNPFKISVPFKKPKNVKFVLTIYDLIPLIYSNHYPSGVKGWLKWQVNKILIRKNIDAIITISETSKKDICRFIGISPKKVHVTYLAPREIFKPVTDHQSLITVQKKFGLPNSFALYVGDINYNKNIPVLIESCRMAGISLVIVGKQAVEIDKMNLNHPELKHLKNIDWKEVIRPGFVSDEELVKVYNLASVYVQASLYEGFGLPAVEAIACKTPMVSTKTQCLVEILGDDFGYVDQKNPKSIAEGIMKPNIGKELPRQYSWQKTADETFKIYSKVTQ